MGLPVVPFDCVENEYSPVDFEIYIATGYNGMNKLRRDKFYEAKEKGYKLPNWIHPSASMYSESIGEGNLIFENVQLGIDCAIGNGNIFLPSALISHHTRVEDFNYFAPRAALAGDCKVGNNCFFGINCTVINGLTISDYTLIGAGVCLSMCTSAGDVILPALSRKAEGRNSSEYFRV
ncbi:hypothetical protein FACS1894188_13580 [Clostridia bacterium]|nr:hypothetical protein FACS1894188_13580 [Clostridia bacterium]